MDGMWVVWLVGREANTGERHMECHMRGCSTEGVPHVHKHTLLVIALFIYKLHIIALLITTHHHMPLPPPSLTNNSKYKDDPTIFAWNLYNEPRCPYNQAQDAATTCFAALQAWTTEMAGYLKSVDPNHLVSWGHEGFFKFDSPRAGNNPFGTPSNVQSGWSGYVGQDFEAQTAVPGIDFGV